MTNSIQDTSRPATSRSASGSWLSLFTVIVLLLAVGGFVLWRLATNDSHPAIGKPAPALNLVALPSPDAVVENWSGLESVTGPVEAGNITMLHFWGTWCPPCRTEYPSLVELMSGYKANPQVRFLPVTCGFTADEVMQDLWTQTNQFYAANGIQSLPTYSDPTGATQIATIKTLSEPGMLYPTTIIVGPDQRIAGVWLGYNEDSLDEMRSVIDELLTQLP